MSMKVKKLKKLIRMLSTLQLLLILVRARGIERKENDKALIKAALKTLSTMEVAPDKYMFVDGTEIGVTYNPYVHLFLMNPGGVAMLCPGGTNVVVDDNFRKMTPECQTWVLAHELGHYTYKHQGGMLYLYERMLHILQGKVMPCELEADRFATSIAGKNAGVEALKAIGKSGDIFSKIEAWLRINAIRKEVK